MKKRWCVTEVIEASLEYFVEADNEEEAIAIAKDKSMELDPADIMPQLDTVEWKAARDDG